MKQVLFPTNFSEESKASFDYARQFSSLLNTQLVVFNSYYSTESPKRTYLEEGTRLDETLRKLKEFIKSDHPNPSPSLMIKAEEGYAIRNIVELSKRSRIELVITNRRENYEWIDRFLGTRLSYICTGAYCPTFVIPPSHSFKRIKKVMVRDNGSALSQSYIHNLFFRLFKNEAPEINTFSELISEREIKKNHESPFSIFSGLNFQSMMQEKEEILRNLKRENPDLLVLVLQQRNLINQLLENTIILPLITELEIPVMVVNQNTIKMRNYNFINKSLGLEELRA